MNADAVPAGETFRVWIPYPRSRPGQHENIRLISSAPAEAHDRAGIHAATHCVSRRSGASRASRRDFSITYELTTFAQHWQIDPAKVQRRTELRKPRQHLGERPPHIVFTPALREFSQRVVGEERNPYRIATKLFDAVDRIPWAGAREYSTISNISDYALHAGHADCGQQTLLLMSLLRLNGIPARWQSGWIFSDGDYDNMHDWGWLYLAPYGWVPMDVTFGRLEYERSGDIGLLLRFARCVSPRVQRRLRSTAYPPKQHFRSETVDSQRGEVEWRGGNLYFDCWDYEFKAKHRVITAQRHPRFDRSRQLNTLAGGCMKNIS